MLPTKEMGRKVSEPLLVVPRSVDISVQSCAVQVNDRESEVIVDEPRPASASGSPAFALAALPSHALLVGHVRLNGKYGRFLNIFEMLAHLLY